MGLGVSQVEDECEVEGHRADDYDGVESSESPGLSVSTRRDWDHWEEYEHTELIDEIEDDEVEALTADE